MALLVDAARPRRRGRPGNDRPHDAPRERPGADAGGAGGAGPGEAVGGGAGAAVFEGATSPGFTYAHFYLVICPYVLYISAVCTSSLASADFLL